jgi:CheY-like chemotaxis protein
MQCLKFLIVDDEHDIEFLFRQKFRKELREGIFDFHFAFSAESALEYLHTLKPFDVVLVLSDINMPGMNGLELLRIIKTEYPDLKVMMVTAYGDEANHQTAISYGADDFITKPVDFNHLRDRISAINLQQAKMS